MIEGSVSAGGTAKLNRERLRLKNSSELTAARSAFNIG